MQISRCLPFIKWSLGNSQKFHKVSQTQISCIIGLIVICDYFEYKATHTSLLHLMQVIACAHASTRPINLKHVKNSTHHLGLRHLLSGTLE